MSFLNRVENREWKEARRNVETKLFNEIKAVQPGFSDREALGQAKLGALATSILTRRAGVPVTQMAQWAPHVQELNGSNTFLSKENDYLVGVNGDEIASTSVTDKELRELAKEWFDKNLRGTSVIHEASKREIKFAGSKKPIATSGNVKKLRLFPALPELIRKGKMGDLIPVRTDHPKGANVKGYYWLTGKVRIGDEVVEVGVTIREDNNGNLYYNHNILESETPQNSEFKPLTKQALEQRGYDEDQSSSVHNGSLNLFVRQDSFARGSFSPSANAITITPNADLSTFLHELGHWYLANLLELSKLDGASASLQEDARAILKEFGLGSVREWDALGLEGQRKYHERFAYWTEIRLATSL